MFLERFAFTLLSWCYLLVGNPLSLFAASSQWAFLLSLKLMHLNYLPEPIGLRRMKSKVKGWSPRLDAVLVGGIHSQSNNPRTVRLFRSVRFRPVSWSGGSPVGSVQLVSSVPSDMGHGSSVMVHQLWSWFIIHGSWFIDCGSSFTVMVHHL